MKPLSRRLAVAALPLSAALLFAVHASAATIAYTAKLLGATEVPANTTTGTGTVDAQFDSTSKQFSWTVTYSGLTGTATAAHFHGPAAAGTNAPPVVPITGSLDNPIKGSAVLTDAQAADLAAGKWYFNIHTAANKGGEIRGQLTTK